MTNSKEILSYMKTDLFDPKNELILEEEPRIESSITENITDIKTGNNTNSIEILKYDFDTIVLKANIIDPTFLFSSEIFFPRWKCYINGKHKKSYKANYLFRAVHLEKGQYKIVFKFIDHGVYAITTILCLLLTLGFIYFMIKNRKKYFLS